MKRAPFLFVSALVFLLGGCASADSAAWPSLDKRPYEGRFDVPARGEAVEPPGALPADLKGQLEHWNQEANRGQQDFSTEQPVATQAVENAQGAAASSEAWVIAQQAVSRLIAARAPATQALADIDRLYLDRASSESFDGLPEIYAQRDRLTEMVTKQDQIIAALSHSLAPAPR